MYDEGTKFSCPYFAAFALKLAGRADGPRVGFTVSRALGNAVTRNRLRRKVREAARKNLSDLSAEWDVVFNPRRGALDAAPPDLEREVSRLFLKCKNS